MSKADLGSDTRAAFDNLGQQYQTLLAQAQADNATIASASTLAELKPVLAAINVRQIKLLKALKAIHNST